MKHIIFCLLIVCCFSVWRNLANEAVSGWLNQFYENSADSMIEMDEENQLRNRNSNSAITYTLGGRLGDNLIAYLHAKWISYKYEIPILCKPFPYFDQLMIAEKEEFYTEAKATKFKNKIELKQNEFLSFNKNSNSLYTISYFPESLEEHRLPDCGINPSPQGRKTAPWPYFAVQWEEKQFLKMIRQLILPRHPMNLIVPPTDCTSVAIHVRKDSGGYDCPLLQETADDQYNPNQQYADVAFPLKCVPDSYYIEQIQSILALFKGQKIYFFIFTDDPNPARISKKFEKIFAEEHLVFNYRDTANNHHSNVLEDFFSMLNFDCLIRPDSNLSIVASKLKNYKVLITPVTHKWVGKKLVIDKIMITRCSS